MEMIEEGRPLAEAIKSGVSTNVMAVSDGSYKHTYGTAAWTLGSPELEDIIHGKVVCPAGIKEQSA
jgi:hypothetical protein